MNSIDSYVYSSSFVGIFHNSVFLIPPSMTLRTSYVSVVRTAIVLKSTDIASYFVIGSAIKRD